jgi:hypothetical protein
MFSFLHFVEETESFLRNRKIHSFVPNIYDVIKTQEEESFEIPMPILRSRWDLNLKKN